MERTRCTDLAEFKSEIQGQSSATEGTRGTRHAASVIGEDNETSTIYLKHNNFEDSRNGDRAFRSGDYVYIHTRKNEIYTKNLKLNVIFSETGDKKTIDKFNCILNCPSHIGSILRIEEGCEGVIDNGPPVVDIQVGDQLFPKSGIILCFRKEDGVYLISALLHLPDDCSCTVRMPGEDEMYTCPKERCACTTPNCFNLLLRYDKDILTLHQWRNFEEVKYESAPIKVVLLGKSGAGNSTLGNRLLQKELFPSTDSIESCTSECSSHVRFLPDGKTSLIVIDTPGLFSSKEKLDTTANKFIKLFKVSTQVNMFLLLVRVDVKFTEEELMTIKVIRKIFGEEILDHTIVILENHGSIKKELKKVIDKAPPSLRDFIAACKDRCLLVNDLLSNKNEKEIDAILKLIKDTVSENGYNHYSCETYEYNIKKFNQKNEKTKQQKFSAPENEAFKCDNVKINYTTDKQMIPSKEKSRISHEHENKLRNNFTFISDNVRSSLKIVMDYLYEKGVLENDHVKRVTAKIDGGDERGAFRLFYDFIVEQGGPTAFVSFKECLEKYGFKTVVERLNSELDIVSNEQSENMTQLQYSSNKMTTAPVQHPATEKQPFCVKLHVAVKEKQSLDVMMVINPDSLHHKQIPSDKYSIDYETMQAQKVTDKYCHQTINNAQSTITTGNTSIRTQSLSNKTSTRLECHETTILKIESSQTPPEPILTNQESIQKSPTTYPNSHDSAIVLTNHKQSISCVTPEKSPVEKIDTNESHSEMRKSRKTTLEDTVYSNTRSENTQRLLSDNVDVTDSRVTDPDVRPKTVSYYETFQLNYSHNSMCKLRIIDRLKKKHKQVHISYFKDNDKVIQLVGNEASVKSAITCLNKYLNELKCDNLELTESKVKLLTKDDTRRMILCDSFEKKDDLVVWETASSNSDLRVISKETKWLEKARAILISFVEESHISVPDDAVHILTDQRWLSFVESVLKEYDDLVDISLTIEGCIYVTAVKNQLSNVKQSIDNFIDNFSQDSFFEKMISHGTVQDRFITMHLKKNLKVNIEQKPNKGILLQGTEKDVIEEEKRISNSISRLITRTRVVQAIFLDSPVGQKVVTNIEENHRCIVDILSKTKVPRQASFEMKNVRIYLVQVDMTRLPVDAIVYPTNSKLRLEGKLARCLTDTGGSSIAVQCEDFVRANGSVSVGGCVVLNSGFFAL